MHRGCQQQSNSFVSRAFIISARVAFLFRDNLWRPLKSNKEWPEKSQKWVAINIAQTVLHTFWLVEKTFLRLIAHAFGPFQMLSDTDKCPTMNMTIKHTNGQRNSFFTE